MRNNEARPLSAAGPRLALVSNPLPRDDHRGLPHAVYILDYEIVLGEDGPYYELRPDRSPDTENLAIYTSVAFLPPGTDPQDAERVVASELIASLPPDTGLSVDPGNPHGHTLTVDDLHPRYRRVG